MRPLLLALLLLGCAEEPTQKKRRAADPQLDLICINELMPSSEAGERVEDQVSDWVELFGKPYEPLDGWSLRWSRGDGEKAHFLDGLELPAEGILLLYPDDLVHLGPEHLPFSLSADGEDLGLRAPDGSEEWISWGPTAADLAHYRTTDCCREPDCWATDWHGTPGQSNTP